MGKFLCTFGHKWTGCKCERCGEVRDEEHHWDLCKGVCRRCGKSQPIQHDWDGCKCRRCGELRDEQHDWNGCRCRICGKQRATDHKMIPVPGKCQARCSICGEVTAVPHTWDLINCCISKCSVCGYVQEEHRFVDGKCTRCGLNVLDGCMRHIEASYDTVFDEKKNRYLLKDWTQTMPARRNELTRPDLQAITDEKARFAAFKDYMTALLKGCKVTFGQYPQWSDKTQPIEWWVLDMDEKGVLLFSDYCLETMAFTESQDTDSVSLTWADSTLRQWLNREFVTTAFTARERGGIQERELTTPAPQQKSETISSKDKVFLLSEEEQIKYDALFGGNVVLLSTATDHCKSIRKRLTIDEKTRFYHVDGQRCKMDGCMWWLRTPGLKGIKAVYPNGKRDANGTSPTAEKLIGVRPALWVSYDAFSEIEVSMLSLGHS